MADLLLTNGRAMREAYLADVRRKRMYGGILLVVFIALMTSGFRLAEDRNAGGFLVGIGQILDPEIADHAPGRRKPFAVAGARLMGVKGRAIAERLVHRPDQRIVGRHDVKGQAPRFGPRQRDVVRRMGRHRRGFVRRHAAQMATQADHARPPGS